jgi:hypothetical protein
MAIKKRVFIFLFIFLTVSILLSGFVLALTADITISEASPFTANKAGYWGGSGFSSQNNFTVPLPIFFEGFRSVPRDSIVNYQWNFGDGSPIINASGQFSAFHVYETPGNYVAILVVTDINGATSSASMPVYARARGGPIRYVDSAIGDDGCLGTSVIVNNATDCPWKTANMAFTSLTGSRVYNLSILFNRGQVFTYNQSHDVNNSIGLYFAAYGNGAKPVITPIDGYNDNMLTAPASQNAINYLTFSDLEFRGGTGGQILYTPQSGIYNTLFLRVNITGYWNPITFSGLTPLDSSYSSRRQDGIYLIDSYVYNSSQVSFAPQKVSRWVVINTTIDHSNNHNIYADYNDRVIITDSVSSRPAFGRNALRITGGINETYPSQNVYVARNFFGGWIDPINCFVLPGGCVGDVAQHNGQGRKYNYELVKFSPQAPADVTLSYSRAELYYTIENNIFTNAEVLMSIGSAENFTVRNNIFITNNSNPDIYVNAIQIGVSARALGGAVDQKPSKKINIIGNTFIQRKGVNALLKIENYSEPSGQTLSTRYKNHEDISILNNIFYLASGSGTTPLIIVDKNDSDLIKNITINNNLYFQDSGSISTILFGIGGINYNFSQWKTMTSNDGNSVYGDPLFTSYSSLSLITDPLYLLIDSFAPNLLPQSSSPAIARGVSIPSLLFYDYSRNLRNILPTIGAFEKIGIGSQICGNGLIEGIETCEGINFGSYSGTCANYNSQYTSGNLTCLSCNIDVFNCVVNNASSSQSSEGGITENPEIPPVSYNGKDLTIGGQIIGNNRTSVCINCNLNVSFFNYELSFSTDGNGNFLATFTNIDFTSGINQINIKIIDAGIVTKEYQKEIYIP